jgi:hypothetical protein
MFNRTVSLLVLGVALLIGCNQKDRWKSPTQSRVEAYEAIVSGMTEEQVTELLGPPSKRSMAQGEGSTANGVQLRWIGHNSLITVYLLDGRVAGKNKL